MRYSFLLAVASILAVTPAIAQTVLTPAVPNAVLTLPPTRNKAAAPPPVLQEQLKLPGQAFPDIEVRGVRIVGARNIPESAIAGIFSGLIGKTATAVQLNAALQAAGRLYATAGYALGRAYIPAQQMKDGILTVRVLEGYVGAVVVNTDTPRVKDTIDVYAARLIGGRPLRTDMLDRVLQLIGDIPGVTVTAKLTDMNLQTGAVALILTVDYQPILPSLALDTRSNVRGLPVQPYLTLKANDLIGTGDQFALTSLLTPIPKDEFFEQASASTAIGDDGWRVTSTTSLGKARANILPSAIDLSSTQLRSELQASYPLVKASDRQVIIDGGSYYSRLSYSLNQMGIAKDRILAGYMEMSEMQQVSPTLSHSLTVRATAGFALPYTPAVPGSRANATRDYAKLDAGGAVSWSPIDAINIILRADGQIATGSLTASEEVSYGGDRFGRGYDSGMVSGDRGVGVSLQPQYSFVALEGWPAAVYVFADYAHVFNTPGDFQANSSLESTGLGLSVGHDIYSATVGLAEPLLKVAGYNFRLSPRLFGSLQVKL